MNEYGPLSDEKINELVAERDAARQAGDFARADQIRKQLEEAGIKVEDYKHGTFWHRPRRFGQ